MKRSEVFAEIWKAVENSRKDQPSPRDVTIGWYNIRISDLISDAGLNMLMNQSLGDQLLMEEAMSDFRDIAAMVARYLMRIEGYNQGIVETAWYSERQYQNKKWGDLDDKNRPEDFLIYMFRYSQAALEMNNPANTEAAGIKLMKVGAIAVAALEKYGVPPMA